LNGKYEVGKAMQNRRRASMLCPNCRKLISVNDAKCPYCGISRPGSWWKRAFSARQLGDTDQLIRWTIYANAGMYLFSLLLEPSAIQLTLNPFGMLSPSGQSLLFLGGTGTIPVFQLHRWWTLIAASYLHGSLLHILFNMIAFSQLAPLALEEYGSYRTFTIYTLSGVFGYIVSCFAGVPFTIGASASVCGLIGALLYYGKSRGGAYGQQIYRQIGAWTLGIFLFGFLVPEINNWAHGGGIVAGIVLGVLLGYRERVMERLAHKVLGVACMTITAVILVWDLASGIVLRFFA
jgi:rhomboid protease GluP